MSDNLTLHLVIQRHGCKGHEMDIKAPLNTESERFKVMDFGHSILAPCPQPPTMYENIADLTARLYVMRKGSGQRVCEGLVFTALPDQQSGSFEYDKMAFVSGENRIEVWFERRLPAGEGRHLFLRGPQLANDPHLVQIERVVRSLLSHKRKLDDLDVSITHHKAQMRVQKKARFNEEEALKKTQAEFKTMF